MKHKFLKFPFGLRTVKTAMAVIIAMILIETLGTTDSKLIFAMFGAMAAVQPTFKESVEACLSDVIGIVFGAICSILLTLVELPPLVAVGIGIILVITLYNALRIRYSPGLPIFVLVLVCTTPDIQPVSYAIGRIWDTAVGLAVGMLINTLVFPYDNSRQIRETAHSLDKELLIFLEDYFDGDHILPDARQMRRKIQTLERQLYIFSNQKLWLHLRRQSSQIRSFQACEEKAQALINHMEALCSMDTPGILNENNRARLLECGAHIQDERPLELLTERDVVANYHVAQLLNLRRELLEALEQ